MKNKTQISRQIAQAIIKDLTDRRGLKQEWNRIEPDIQKAIEQRWVDLSVEVMGAWEDD